MPPITRLDGRTKMARAEKEAFNKIVRDHLAGKATPLQTTLARMVAADMALLETLDPRASEAEFKLFAEIRQRKDKGLQLIAHLKEGTDWLKPIRLPEPDADEQSSKVA
jgi:hypothetical protein